MQFLEISAILLTYLSRSEVETFIVKVLLDLLLPLRKLNLLSAFKLVESEIKFSGYNFRNKNCISTISIDTFIQYWSSRPEVFCEKDVLRNFTKFSGKHLCQSLFFRGSAPESLLNTMQFFSIVRMQLKLFLWHLFLWQ